MTTLSYTGAFQTYTVPAGVYYLQVDAYGAEGGYRSSEGMTRGAGGARVRAIVPVTPGEVLRAHVGGSPNKRANTSAGRSAGGWNGGGNSFFKGQSSGLGNGGGGATDIRRAPYATGNRILVAGGGGGNGFVEGATTQYRGGAGGYLGLGAAGAGAGFAAAAGGKGANNSGGGAGGASTGDASRTNGATGTATIGGAGGNSAYSGTGGGGGGGHYGGGGGGTFAGSGSARGAAGGGGSSYLWGGGNPIDSTADINFTGSTALAAPGDGLVEINPYVPPVPTVVISRSTGGRMAQVLADVIHSHGDPTKSKIVQVEMSRSVGFTDSIVFDKVYEPGIKILTFSVPMTQQGIWFFRVRAGGTDNLPWSDWTTTRSLTSEHVPSATIVSPANGAAVDYAATTPFTFNASDPAASEGDLILAYQILAYDNTTNELLYDSERTDFFIEPKSFGTDITENLALPSTMFERAIRWTVRVWDTTNTPSPESSAALFVLTRKPVVTVTDPVNLGTVDSGAPTFKWSVAPLTFSRKVAKTVITVTDTRNNIVSWSSTINGEVFQATPPSTMLVNNVDYIVRIVVTDSRGLVGEAASRFKTSYVSPDPIRYTVIDNRQEDLGAIVVDWTNSAPDATLVAWRIYRRDLPNMDWVLIEEINDAAVMQYMDFLVKSNSSYMYTVTQVADRSGVLLESPVGYRSKDVLAPNKTNYALNPDFESEGQQVPYFKNVFGTPGFENGAAGFEFGAGVTSVTTSTAVTGSTGPASGTSYGVINGNTSSTLTNCYVIRRLIGDVRPGSRIGVRLKLRRNTNIGSVSHVRISLNFYNEGEDVQTMLSEWFTISTEKLSTEAALLKFIAPEASYIEANQASIKLEFSRSAGAAPCVGPWTIQLDEVQVIVDRDEAKVYRGLDQFGFPLSDFVTATSTDVVTGRGILTTGLARGVLNPNGPGTMEVKKNFIPNPLPTQTTAGFSNTGATLDAALSGTWAVANITANTGLIGFVTPETLDPFMDALYAEAEVRIPSTGGIVVGADFRIEVAQLDAQGALITNSVGPWAAVNNDNDNRAFPYIRFNRNVNTVTTRYRLAFKAKGTATTGQFNFRNMYLGSHDEFFSGMSTEAGATFAWLGATGASVSTRTVYNVMKNAWSSLEWKKAGTKSLRVYSETTYQVTGPVVSIAGRYAGQVASLNGTTISVPSDGARIVFNGSGTLALGAGWWDLLNDGDSVYWDGSTPGTADTVYVWNGTPGFSSSTQSEIPSFAEDRLVLVKFDKYWLLCEARPELNTRINGVTTADQTEEYESESYNIIGRGRHTDYGDRLGYSGSLVVHIRQPEPVSMELERISLLRREQETYHLRTPFGKLFTVSLGDLSWSPLAGVGDAEMGDLTVPYLEVN